GRLEPLDADADRDGQDSAGTAAGRRRRPLGGARGAPLGPGGCIDARSPRRARARPLRLAIPGARTARRRRGPRRRAAEELAERRGRRLGDPLPPGRRDDRPPRLALARRERGRRAPDPDRAMTLLAAITAPSGPVFEFFVLFAVILFGPIIFTRFKLPGLIGLVLGGFAIGAHGLGWISAGNHTVPELGHL